MTTDPRKPAPSAATRIARRDVVKFPDTGPPNDPKRPHAFVVLDVVGDDVVAVPICTKDEESDTTCVIMPGEASAEIVRRLSCIEYRFATKRPLASVVAMVEAAPRRALGPLPQDVYDRVVEGLGVSPRARGWTRKLFFPEPARRILRDRED